MFASINQSVRQYAVLTEKETALFNDLLKQETKPRKALLLQEGQVCHFESYINKGCVRSYYIDDKGDEVVLQFAIEGWWVSDIASFHERTPSRLFIETLEDCELLTLTPESKEQLLAACPKFERMFRILVQRNLARMQERFFRTITTTAAEKYLDFLERYPTIPQRVAQHHIASYLGISPEFLSKVRTRMAKR